MILCIGTTPTVQRTMFFDRVVPDEVNRAARVYEYASGKGVNVARVLRAVGEAALAAGFAGGARGEFLRAELTREAIAHEFVTIERPSRLCTTVIDRGGGTVTELVEESPAATPAEWGQFIHLVEESLPDVDVAVFSGTLAGGAPADFIARWIGRGPRVVVDAQGEPLRLAIERGGCVVKVNRQELGQTLGIDLADGAAVVGAVRRATPRDGWMIVTMGRDGLIGSDGSAVWRARGPTIDAVNPIGSGDAVAAGVAAGIVRGLGFDRVLRLGAACGMANALTMLAGEVRIEDVNRFEREISVERP